MAKRRSHWTQVARDIARRHKIGWSQALIVYRDLREQRGAPLSLAWLRSHRADEKRAVKRSGHWTQRVKAIQEITGLKYGSALTAYRALGRPDLDWIRAHPDEVRKRAAPRRRPPPVIPEEPPLTLEEYLLEYTDLGAETHEYVGSEEYP